MTDSPWSRRQFIGATAGVAAVGALPASAAEARPSPLAPEPPPPPGVCQRLGSARFRELTFDATDSGVQPRFTPDSKWLVRFGEADFLGYEVATGRRVKWELPGGRTAWDGTPTLTNDAVVVWDETVEFGDRPPRIYDRETGRERQAPKLSYTRDLLFTPDTRGVLVRDDKSVTRYDLTTTKRVWQRKWQCDASVPTVTLTVSEMWVVGVGMKRLYLFDPLTGATGPRLEDAGPKDAPPDNHFVPLGFSADFKRLAGLHTAEVPGDVVVWDVATGKVIGRVSMPQRPLNAALTADGSHILATDDNNRLVGYDVRTGAITRRLAAESVGQFVLSPDGGTLACGRANVFLGQGFGGFIEQSDCIVRLLNPATGELLPQSPDPSADLTAVRFADRYTVVSDARTDGASTAHLLWDVRTGRRRRLTPPRQHILFGGLGVMTANAGVLSPDGTRYVGLSGDNGASVALVTDAVTGRRLHQLPVQVALINHDPLWLGRGCVGFVQPDGLMCWNLADRTTRTVPLKFAAEGSVQNIAATPDGRTAALMHTDANEETPAVTLAWVDVRTGEVTTRPGEFGQLSISADGSRVAVTAGLAQGRDSDIRVTLVDRDGRRQAFRQESSSQQAEVRAELSPCGRTAFLAHEKPGEGEAAEPIPVVQFWEALNGEKRVEFSTPFIADGLGVSPCGRRIATSHRDAPVYLWDVFGERSDPQAKPDATVWAALDGPADKAFAAIRRLVQHPVSAVELLAAKLTPAEQPKAEWVKARIDRLASRDFRTRHTAELDLSAVADRIAEPLRKAIAAGGESPEADERLTRLLEKAEGIPRATWRAVRAVEVLEYCDTPSAAVLLMKLAGGVESAVLTKEAKAAVRRLK